MKKYVESARKFFRSSIFLLLFLIIPFKSHGNNSSFSSGQLSNGLTYYIHHDPHAKQRISIDFIIKTGSLDEQEDERGFSHLIEHIILNQMQFKDKKICDAHCDIWDFTRPNIGAVTSYNFTQYHLEISLAIPWGLEAGLLGFSNTLSQFSLDEPALQDMKDQVLDEIDKTQLSPIESWKQWRLSQEYPPYRSKHPLGNQEAISQASLENIYQFYREKYQPHRIGVVIIGNIDLQEIKHLLEKHLGNISAYENMGSVVQPEDLSAAQIPNFEIEAVYIHKGLKNTLISLAKPLPKMSQRDSLSLSILTQMLSQHLRNYAAAPQAAFAKPILDILTYPELLRITVSLKEDFEEGTNQLKSALMSFFNQSITEDQLNQIKTEMENSLIALREKGSGLSLIDFYREHFILNASSLEADHPSLRIALLSTIHVEDINQLLQTFQGFSQVSLGSPHEKAALISADLLFKLKNDHWRVSHVD